MANNRQSTLSDLDDLLKELDNVEQQGRSSLVVKAPAKQRDSTKDFDELEKLVAQFDEEKGKSPTPTPTPKPAPTPAPSNPTPAPSNVAASPAPSILENKRSSVFHKDPPSLQSSSNNACGTCGKVVEGPHILALGKIFHTNHLTCANCAADLRGDFYDQNGKFMCKNCTATLFPCSVCGKAIEKDYYLGDGKFFHPACVDRNYCDRCNSEILPTTRKLSALGKHWHADCFKCTGCSVQLDTTFYAKNNQPYCGNCSQSSVVGSKARCVECDQDVVPGSTFVSYGGRSYHQHCFKCFKCHNKLNHEQFYNVNGTAQCQSCAMNG